MTSIVFLIEAIYCNIFRRKYLRKEKYFLIFFSIFEIQIQFWIFSKKRWPSWLMYFRTDALAKTWLDKSLKSLVSEDTLKNNMVNGPKHCSKLNHSTFIIFIDPCEDNSVRKIRSSWYGKSWDCLLTHWLLTTSILLLIETIDSNIFRCNYLRNEKYFPNFFLHFGNWNSILNIF